MRGNEEERLLIAIRLLDPNVIGLHFRQARLSELFSQQTSRDIERSLFFDDDDDDDSDGENFICIEASETTK